MAIQQVILVPKESGRQFAYQATEAVAEQIVADFVGDPDPDVQQYSVLKGNASQGWTATTLAINWGEKFHMVWYFEATEQPPS